MENNTANTRDNIRNINQIRAAAVHEEDTIDLLELAGVLLRKLWLLIICFIIGAGAAGAYTYFMITPQYQASSLIYVYSKTTSITSVADLQLSNQLAGDFTVVATTRPVLETVIDDLDLDISTTELAKKISVTNPSDTHMLKITITDASPELAASISNDLAKVLRNQIADIMNTDAPSMVESAVAPTNPVSPSLYKNAALGGLVLALLAAVLITLRYMLDDTIKTDEDVRKYLGVNTLSALPIEKGKAA